jgi:hypothetical protein
MTPEWVQAVSTVVGVLATLALVVITWRYAVLTRELVGQNQRMARAATARDDQDRRQAALRLQGAANDLAAQLDTYASQDDPLPDIAALMPGGVELPTEHLLYDSVLVGEPLFQRALRAGTDMKAARDAARDVVWADDPKSLSPGFVREREMAAVRALQAGAKGLRELQADALGVARGRSARSVGEVGEGIGNDRSGVVEF